MAVLAWVMVGLAIWHFVIWLPDRIVGGIVGSFLIAAAGAALGGYALNGFSVPSPDDLDILVPLQAIPGTLIALAIGYAVGSARERAQGDAA